MKTLESGDLLQLNFVRRRLLLSVVERLASCVVCKQLNSLNFLNQQGQLFSNLVRFSKILIF